MSSCSAMVLIYHSVCVVTVCVCVCVCVRVRVRVRVRVCVHCYNYTVVSDELLMMTTLICTSLL